MAKPAYLCHDCGFASKKDNCCKCGKWCGSIKHPARLCNNCGSGQVRCVKCGKPVLGSNKVPAVLCNNCGFANKKDYCVKCGKWAP